MQLKKEIKIMLGCLRRADQDFKLIEDGDKIAVGISGGKDSLALLYALRLYQKFSKKAFELQGITVSMGMQPFDLSGVAAFCKDLDVKYTVVETQIGRIVFDERQEKNPCALCANMRRGALNNAALAAGCNKTALGHHSGDVVGTFLMSLLYESRLNTFSPKTFFKQKRPDGNKAAGLCRGSQFKACSAGAGTAGCTFALPGLRTDKAGADGGTFEGA